MQSVPLASPLASPLLFRGTMLALVVGILLVIGPNLFGRLGVPVPAPAIAKATTPGRPTPVATPAARPSVIVGAPATVEPTPTAIVVPTVTPSPPPNYISHRVASGETLGSIAERYGTTVDVLVRYNGLQNADQVKEGQEIAIPKVEATAQPTVQPATAGPAAEPTSTPGAASYVVHQVKPGETLVTIAERYDTTADVLARFNGLSDADQIKVGQEIAIPRAEGAPPPQPKPLIHRVAPGETLVTIAEGYGTTVDALVRYNGLSDADHVIEGQEIAIP